MAFVGGLIVVVTIAFNFLHHLTGESSMKSARSRIRSVIRRQAGIGDFSKDLEQPAREIYTQEFEANVLHLHAA